VFNLLILSFTHIIDMTEKEKKATVVENDDEFEE
jgi:hypothetical protein